MRRTPLPVEQECEICGYFCQCARHEIFYGTANRKLSIKWGMVIFICPACHRQVHDDPDLRDELEAKYQQRFEEQYPDEKFMAIFGKNCR